MYFILANRYNIIDKPNHRSSHSKPTVRGGGIIMIIALLCWAIFYGFQYHLFIVGSLIIAMISFVDDIKAQHAAIRFLVHCIAFALLLYQIPFISSWWMILLICLVGIGALNAFNFMDGINGITGIYAIVNFLTLFFINQKTSFTSNELILYALIGVGVFMLFNFRPVARCFAGDVGSIVLAYIQLFLVLQLVQFTEDYRWVLFFLVYGIDAVATITYRLINKENIFKPHRSHLYQYLANERKISHLTVSSVYGVIQFLININLIISWNNNFNWMPVLLIAVFTIFYLILRERVLKQIGTEGVVYKIFKLK